MVELGNLQEGKRPNIFPMPVLPSEPEYDESHSTWSTSSSDLSSSSSQEHEEFVEEQRRDERRAQKLAAYHALHTK